MKQYFKVVIISLLSTFLIIGFFLKKEEEVKDIYAFEVGFYNDYNSANEYSKKINNSRVIPQGDGYHVVVALYEDINIINKMLIYYSEKEIDVKLEKISCDKNFLSDLNKYENIVTSLDNKELYDKVNENILDMYLDRL